MAFRRPKDERKETGKPVAGPPSGVLYKPAVSVFVALGGVVNLMVHATFNLSRSVCNFFSAVGTLSFLWGD